MTKLNTLSVAELLKLRSDVDDMLQTKRDELNAQLAEIGGNTASKASDTRRSKLAGKKVQPKYRHPKSGRALVVRPSG
jgi:hypothetical protein